MRKLFLLFVSFGFMQFAMAQSKHTLLRDGDTSYKNEDFASAEENYRRALEKEASEKAMYNLGNALYQQDRMEEAAGAFEQALSSSDDPKVQSQAYHNLGNTLFQMGEYEKSVEAYKNALRLDPQDFDTKYNLAQAQRQLVQQQQQNQQQQQDQNQQQQENEEDQQGQGQDQEQPSPPQDNQGGSSPQEQERDLSRDEAEELLRIAEEEEQKVQGKMQQGEKKPSKSRKDW